MKLADSIMLLPFIAPGEALTIVSFERRRHDVAREAAEDRSLNLALRRRRVRSEVMRIPLDADAATQAFLTDVVGALSGRRLIILARELAQFPDAFEVMLRLCDLAAAACVIIVASESIAFAHPNAVVAHIDNDGSAEIEMIADALIITQHG